MARFFLGARLLELERERQERVFQTQRRVFVREYLNPLEMSDTEFRARYRFDKHSFNLLADMLRNHTDLRSSQRITLEMKVLCALFFYATGSYQRMVGATKFVCQRSTSQYITEVTNALNHPAILQMMIQFPCTQQARAAISQKFFDKFGIPGVVGAIDGTHIRIVHPLKAEEHLYYCRKHYHSLNVLMICDSDGRILCVNPKYSGWSHDAFVWENCPANPYMQSLHQNNDLVWLLGDAGYPLRPWMMVPVQDAAPGSVEARFNAKHSAARVIIENTFGRLKNRWRCCIKDRALHYKPAKCARIILACCVLHNFALNHHQPEPQRDEQLDRWQDRVFRRVELMPQNGEQAGLAEGRALRDLLITRMV